jgi:hypothetical protein
MWLHMKRVGKIVKLPEKTVRAILIFLAGLLTFAGPTYMMYVFQRLGVPSLLYVLLGLASFTAGVILFLHLFRREPKPEVSTEK